MFLPTTLAEAERWGWSSLDVILVTGDAHIDSPFIGAAVIGRVLVEAGYRVGVIAQPDIDSDRDIARLGEPALFWGVTGGSVDSMVANYTATGKRRKSDDFTPGGVNDRRPDRAAIVYTNLIRRYFKGCPAPIALGGIEASLRRVAHYDFWSNKIRRSILFDAKADYLLYGMGERSVVELAASLKAGRHPHAVRGLCYVSSKMPADCVELPSYEECAGDKDAFTAMFHEFYRNNDPVSARRLAQRQDTRYLIQNPPAHYLTGPEMDAVHALPYEREAHPAELARGEVRALDTIRFSIATHEGCYGECNFCAIAVHQGRRVRWRSEASILDEAREMTSHPKFKGTIRDVGGPTANMYGFECKAMAKNGACENKRCLFPNPCKALPIDHAPQIELLDKLRQTPGVKNVFVASGLRHDLVLADEANGEKYLRRVVRHHTSGQLKIAPEHVSPRVLKLMGKPGQEGLERFVGMFGRLAREDGRPQFLTYYFIAAHPGCGDRDMRELKNFAARELHLNPEQVQIFTPTPSTYSSLMYWTGRDPWTGAPLFVEKTLSGKNRQKTILTGEGSAPQGKRPPARHHRLQNTYKKTARPKRRPGR